MNLELVERMTELLETRRTRYSEIAEEYKTAKGDKAKELYNEAAELVAGNNRINKTIKAVIKANSEYENAETLEAKNEASEKLETAQNNLYALANEFGVTLTEDEIEEEIEEEVEEIPEEEISEEELEEKQTEKKKNNTLKYIGVGLMGMGIGAGITSCAMSQKPEDTTKDEVESQLSEIDEDEKIESEVEQEFTEEITQEEEKVKIEDVDTEYYGMTSAFTDASDEKQVMQRATDIYNTYINIDTMPEAMKQQLSVERIANFIRMANGEFALEDGNIDYNSSMHDEMANIMASYYNATSFVEYGQDLQFKPTCIFFENDSLAHHSAAENDALLAKVYEDIRQNDIENFEKDAVAWGEFVRDTFIYNDFTGERISIWAVDNEQKYPLTSAIISAYGPSIMEYSLGVDLATRNSAENIFGDTFGICIPFCYDANNELQYIPLSEMIYHINFTPMNYLAQRAGFGEEWAEKNVPITVEAYQVTREYFDSKYNLEVGNTLKLK